SAHGRSRAYSCRRSMPSRPGRGSSFPLPEGPLIVYADPNQIERVLVNLIENALHHSPLTEPVHVRTGRTRSEALVRVVDHGPGLAGNELKQIFEPFRRGSRSDGTRGAGLGLAIARGFAHANSGRVWAESLDGQGAAFVLALPLADQRPPLVGR